MTAHAVADFADQCYEGFREWKRDSNSIIVLGVDDEESLKRQYEKVRKLLGNDAYGPVSFAEPDIDDQWTSIAFYAPFAVRRKLRHLPVVGRKEGQLNKTFFASDAAKPLEPATV